MEASLEAGIGGRSLDGGVGKTEGVLLLLLLLIEGRMTLLMKLLPSSASFAGQKVV